MYRLVEAEQGCIKIDGVDLNSLGLKQVLSSVDWPQQRCMRT